MEWQVESVAFSASSTHEGAGETTVELEVDATNLTTLDLVVALGGGVARVQPTHARVEVTPPDGNSTQAQEVTLPAGPASAVEVPFTFNLSEVPTQERVSGSSPEAARDALAAAHPGANGTGTWRVVVTFAPGAPGPLAGDEAHEVTVEATAQRYEAQVRPETPEVRR